MEKRFHLKEHGTTVRTEIMAGITTFMAMAYILMVNAGMFASLGTVSYGAIYIATAISAVIGTVLIGLLSNLPLAQASGMGLNAFFVYTVCFGFGLSYANALVLVLVDGIIFVLLTVTGLRKMIFDAIPAAVKTAISAGIGLFIAFIGLQNAGIVVDDGATLVNLASFNVFTGEATWASIFPMLITLIAVFVIGALSKKKVKGAVLRGEDTDTILDCAVRLRHDCLDQRGVLGATDLRNQATNAIRHFLVAVPGHAADTIGNEHKYGRGSKPAFVHVLIDSAAIRGEGLHELGKFHN